jgi:hypothetical protein
MVTLIKKIPKIKNYEKKRLVIHCIGFFTFYIDCRLGGIFTTPDIRLSGIITGSFGSFFFTRLETNIRSKEPVFF